MCGIVGGIGKFDIRSYIIEGLKSLDYRGYDSAGIALKTANKVWVYKTVGRVEQLEAKTPEIEGVTLGIGHTRWATHGAPTEENCHPQQSMYGKFTIVHNGVIENFRELKNRLLDEGYTFVSETDTEVIANLIDEKYAIAKKNTLEAIRLAIAELKGSFALAIVKRSSDHKIYFAKRHSPLLIGVGEGSNYLASDAVPMIKKCSKFIDLENDQYGYISEKEVVVLKDGKKIPLRYTERNAELLNRDLGNYPHYMLKEIEEAPMCIQRLIDNYFDGKKYLFSNELMNVLENADNIIFLACGTSYYASLMGKHYMESLGKRSEAYIASEWAYYPHFGGKNPIFIFVSQSGETADLIRCMQLVKEHNCKSITITNTKGSTLEREATYSLLLYAGVEVAVASTKAYSAQVALLALLKGAYENNFDVVDDLIVAKEALKKIEEMKEDFHFIARRIKDKKNIFFLGRGLDYNLCLEGSLKLKEITYIHSEAFPGGELKHGPIALIEKGTPVFGYISDKKTAMPLRANYQEVKARGAEVISIVSASLKNDSDTIVVPDAPYYLCSLVKVMVAQYIAYYTAFELGLDIDKPRNLAKSVTVE